MSLFSGNKIHSTIKESMRLKVYCSWVQQHFFASIIEPPPTQKNFRIYIACKRYNSKVNGAGGGVGLLGPPEYLDTITGFIRGILRGVRYAKSLRVLFLHRRSPSWTSLVLYSRAVFIFNEPTICVLLDSDVPKCMSGAHPTKQLSRGV